MTSLTFGADVSSFFWLSDYCIFCRRTWLLYCWSFHLLFNSPYCRKFLFKLPSNIHVIKTYTDNLIVISIDRFYYIIFACVDLLAFVITTTILAHLWPVHLRQGRPPDDGFRPGAQTMFGRDALRTAETHGIPVKELFVSRSMIWDFAMNHSLPSSWIAHGICFSVDCWKKHWSGRKYAEDTLVWFQFYRFVFAE